MHTLLWILDWNGGMSSDAERKLPGTRAVIPCIIRKKQAWFRRTECEVSNELTLVQSVPG